MSAHVHIRFNGELNEFLPAAQRDSDALHELKKARSVKDLLESVGVPHPEVDVILVNGYPVDFEERIEGGERIEVYPAGADLSLSPLIHNQPAPPDEPCFVLDVHLGRLARYLRMLGFDTLYRNDYEDPKLAEISDEEQRILLTSDRKLLMRRRIQWGYYIRSRKPREQVVEVLRHFKLFDYRAGEKRCINCNGIIQPVDKPRIESRLLPLTKKYYHEFYQCDRCSKIYWQGSHHAKMQRLIETIRAA
jgi:uncharacterized protein with PIN domain/sulfur carrier protein ThiS